LAPAPYYAGVEFEDYGIGAPGAFPEPIRQGYLDGTSFVR
jgi:hypothetical protein